MAAVGDTFTCLLNQEGGIFFLGSLYPTRYNVKNEMDYINPMKFTPKLQSNKLINFVKVVAGPQHLAAIDSYGKLYTWGKK